MSEDLYDFLASKAKMTDSSECGSIIECMQGALENYSLAEPEEPRDLEEDLNTMDCILDQFKEWAESLKEDLAEFRKEHVKPVKP